MTTVAKKLMLGTAAFAVAGALISPVVAVADTDDSPSDSVGTSAGNTPKRDRGAVARAEARNGGSSTGSSAADSGSTSAPTADANDPPETPDIPAVGAGDSPASVPSIAGDATANATGPFDNPLFQNPLIWLGTPNPAPPTPIVEFETLPLADVPEGLQGAFGWMKNFEFEACVLGLSSVSRGQNVIGPYGAISTNSVSGSGCA